MEEGTCFPRDVDIAVGCDMADKLVQRWHIPPPLTWRLLTVSGGPQRPILGLAMKMMTLVAMPMHSTNC